VGAKTEDLCAGNLQKYIDFVLVGADLRLLELIVVGMIWNEYH